jgi:hypothetical protein
MYGSDRGPMTPFEWWFSALFLAGLLAAFGAIVIVDYEPVKLVPLFFVLSWIVLLPLHEAGHAVVAYLVGWYVGQVVIGMGRPLRRFTVGPAHVEIRAFPVEGFCRTVPRDLHWPRLKNAVIYFAGPGVELLLLGLVVLLAGFGPMTTRSNDLGILAAQGFALAVLASAFMNLFPHYAVTPQGLIPNDGLGILQSFTKPDSHFESLIGWKYDPERERWSEDAAEERDEW